jgi:hypothetical protein
VQQGFQTDSFLFSRFVDSLHIDLVRSSLPEKTFLQKGSTSRKRRRKYEIVKVMMICGHLKQGARGEKSSFTKIVVNTSKKLIETSLRRLKDYINNLLSQKIIS